MSDPIHRSESSQWQAIMAVARILRCDDPIIDEQLAIEGHMHRGIQPAQSWPCPEVVQIVEAVQSALLDGVMRRLKAEGWPVQWPVQ